MNKINESIEEITTGKKGFNRRHFITGAAATAVGASALGLAACGNSPDAAQDSVADAPAELIRLRIATQKQEGPAAPWMTKGGSLQILSCVSEYLIWLDPLGSLEPAIATEWKATDSGKTWTITIRTDVTFHDGSPLTADDIIYTFESHLDEASASQSAALLGDLKSGSIVKVDDTTIVFNLEKVNANFPYVLSNTSYGLCIIKSGEKGDASWATKMNGAGPWVMVSHTEGDRTLLTPNLNYYDAARIPQYESMEQIQYVSAATALPALKTGEIESISLLLAADAATLSESDFTLVKVPTCGGLHLHMRCDIGKFVDKRIRQAAALTIDREAFIDGVLLGAAEIANDSVMESFKTTVDTSVPQRMPDIEAAKALMAEAGVPNGFDVVLNTWKRDDNDKFAQYVKTAWAQIGINVTLEIDGSDGGASVFYTYVPYPAVKGESPENNGSWLACEVGIAEWAGRAVPDPYLVREWRSDGDWNAAHVNDADIDAAIDMWTSAITPTDKKAASSAIQKASLEATPYIVAYNETRISATSNKIAGLLYNAQGGVYSSGQSA